MRRFAGLWLLAVCAIDTVQAQAADLTKIERTIAREPASKAKPQYVLLVGGADAKSPVWLVRDGNVLYVDRSGNGDLTAQGNRFVVKGSSLAVGELKVGDTRYYLGLNWYKRKNVNGVCWMMD